MQYIFVLFVLWEFNKFVRICESWESASLVVWC